MCSLMFSHITPICALMTTRNGRGIRNIKEFIANRHPSQVDLVPDRLSDVAVILLSLLCVILTVVLLYANKQHRALERQLRNLETQNITESTFVKHKLLGMQMEDLRKGDSRRSRRELSLEDQV